ncbi:MAG TPA: type I-B CRISPR-associated endonuclease Cas1 [Candidatus Fraserbacteria bacterium]|nr:type I-B CRISPR-associated endonuclease Cas1 [Candidatus Fraserbacteria bacterium]
MARDYYLFQSGTLRRKQNTLYFENEAGRRPIPIEDVSSLYIFGELTLNTKLLSFLGQQGVPMHFFSSVHEYYMGSYYPREHLNSGYLFVRQVEHYLQPAQRLEIARELVAASSDNLLRVLKYYRHRVSDAELLPETIAAIERDQQGLAGVRDTLELMAIEGRMRERYYHCFNAIIKLEEPFVKRVRRPPDSPINTLISFGNALLYATTLSEIYKTQLVPTVSYLHEPGARRFSLSLDLSELFKPLLVDRVVFKLLNNRMLREGDFERALNYCYLSESGRKTFVRQYDERLSQTIEHRQLKRRVSYRRLIRLECYKLVKHLLGEQRYEGFRAWW